MSPLLKGRQRLGKYRIVRRLATSGYSQVFEAYDTIEGVRVAIKVPYPHLIDSDMLSHFRREVRITAQLDHPHILPLKDANIIDNLFVLVYRLGERSLHDRMQSRMSSAKSLDYADQLLDAVAYAHRHRVLHCDIKPDNIILFRDDQLRLTDFGLARVTAKTIHEASGAGTIGYMAPEQALGNPSLRSDVFAVGLIVYELFARELPSWPFEWPLPGHRVLKKKVSTDLVDLLRRTLSIQPKRRHADANELRRAFLRIKPKALRKQR